MKLQKPILHGRDHACGGADPIPGICNLTNPATGNYTEKVLAEPSLIGYWPLDDPAAPALDHSSLGRNLTQTNIPPTWGASGPFTSVPATTAVLFAAASGLLVNTDALEDANPGGTTYPYAFAGVAPYTWEILAYPTALETSHPAGLMGVFSYPGGSPEGIYLKFTEAGTIRMHRAGLNWDSSAVLTLNKWVHIAMSYDGATIRLYFDGEQQVAAATAAAHAASGLLRLATTGYNVDWHGNFHGRLAQAAIYNVALDAGTIASHANVFKGGGGADNSGDVLTVGPDGTPVWAPPKVTVTTNGVPADPGPVPIPDPPPTDPTGLPGWNTDWLVDQPYLWDGPDFTVQPNTWTTIPFAQVSMQRFSNVTGVGTTWTEISPSDPASANWVNPGDPHAIRIPHDMPFDPGSGYKWLQVCLRLEYPWVEPTTSRRALRVFETTNQKTLMGAESWRDIATAEGGGVNVYKDNPAGTFVVFADGDLLDAGGHDMIMFGPSQGGYGLPGLSWLPKDSGGNPTLKAGMRLVAQCWHNVDHPLTFHCTRQPSTNYYPHFVIEQDVYRSWGAPWSTWVGT